MTFSKYRCLISKHSVNGDRFSATAQYAEIQRQYNLYKQKIDNYGIDAILEIESCSDAATNSIQYAVSAKCDDQTQLAMITMLINEVKPA